ncbi:GrpB family protein [Lactiplantibacillus daowaiensis]|uniref:GrpB family protein n=1 Tax=Lactiplantibacillus daowaiensis TaxID=2559918 RepID=A0ABW1RX64_9LACO|nr:GrpB family protein [Lactiplantibacillus daowaiensis]
MQKIEVVPYQATWPAVYQDEARQIKAILGPALVAMHHIGSTAVPGLAAKSIIDILPVVHDITVVDQLTAQFAALGYEGLGEYGIVGRRYFRKGGDDRTHQLHIFDVSQLAAIARHLAVRDYLRLHPDVAQIYGQLKRTAARHHPCDITGYGDEKASFVTALEQIALQEVSEDGS